MFEYFNTTHPILTYCSMFLAILFFILCLLDIFKKGTTLKQSLMHIRVHTSNLLFFSFILNLISTSSLGIFKFLDNNIPLPGTQASPMKINNFISKSTLLNGLQIFTIHSNSGTSSITFDVGVGSRYETLPEELGICHALEHMLFQGMNFTDGNICDFSNKYYSPEEINKIRTRYAVGNAATGGRNTRLFFTSLNKYLEPAAYFYKNMLLNSQINPANWLKEREIILKEINMHMDNSARLICHAIAQNCYPAWACLHDTTGTEQQIKNLTAEQIKSFYQKHYKPNRICIFYSGNMTHRQFVNFVDKKLGFGKLTNNNMESKKFEENLKFNYFDQVVHVEKDQREWLVIEVFDAPTLKDKQRFALNLGINILGGVSGSKLHAALRLKNQLAYSTSANYYPSSDHGFIILKASTTKEKSEEVRKILLEEAQNLCDNLTQEDLDRQRDLKIMTILNIKKSQDAVNMDAINRYLEEGENFTSLDEELQLIQNLTLEDVKSALKKYLLAKHNSFTLGKN